MLIPTGLGCGNNDNADAGSGGAGKHSLSDAGGKHSDGGAHGAKSDGGKDGGASADGGVLSPADYPKLSAAQFGAPTQVANGFTLAEGPVWDPCGKQLLFTDVTASVINTLDADGKVGVFMKDTNNANGIAFDIDGSLILAQMGGMPGHIARRDKSGKVSVLDPPGSMLHTPDDVIVRSDGTIYFSDADFPPIGTGAALFNPLPVYALKPGGTKLIDGGAVIGPNGVELSPDEKTLYVDAYIEGTVVKFDVADDGTPKKGATLATGLTNPDSLCLDAAGNLYVGVSTGVQVLRPDGSDVTTIPVSGTQGVTNCTFGGSDGTTFYITAWTTVWKVDGMPIPGLDWVVNQKRLKCGS